MANSTTGTATLAVLVSVCLGALGGCGDPTQNIIAGIAAATAVGGYTPSNELEQTYYVGVFDPQEQLPPQMAHLLPCGMGVRFINPGPEWDALLQQWESSRRSG